MNDLQNFQATVNHQPPERILFYADFVEDLRQRVVEHIGGKDPAVHYGMARQRAIAPVRPEGVSRPDFSKYWEGQTLPPGTRINASGVAMVPSGYYHFWGYVSPLRNATSLAELENYPIDDIARHDCTAMRPAVEAAHAEGRYAVGWAGHMFEEAWQIRGLTEFLMDLIEQPAWAECLLERIMQRNLLAAKAAAAAGVDLLRTGDDVATQQALMFSPDTWRRLMLPRWRTVWQAAKAVHPGIRIWYHSDGNILDIIPDLIEAGVDVLNPLQPECLDIDEVYRRHGSRLVMDGCMGTQSTMPFGTPTDVRLRVRELIGKYGRNGGLILSPTHVLEPEVPLANIDAFCGACREYGTR
jgi:uroporphyrinogen decarboxylase